VARFKDLNGSDGGLPDSNMPGCERTLFNVIGFQPPKGEGDSVTSPVGGDASRAAAIPISEGFNLGYCKAKPGHGPMMHNHDTNETVHTHDRKMAVQLGERGRTGRVSRPRSARRHFLSARGNPALRECDPGDKSQEHILMFVIGGDGPRAEFTDDSMKELEHAGVWPPKAGSAQAASKG
jgi:hypothetical protein